MERTKKLLDICKKHFPNSRGNPESIEIVRENEKKIAKIEITGSYLFFKPEKSYFLGLNYKNREKFFAQIEELFSEVKSSLLINLSSMGKNDLDEFNSLNLDEVFFGMDFKKSDFIEPFIYPGGPKSTNTQKERSFYY